MKGFYTDGNYLKANSIYLWQVMSYCLHRKVCDYFPLMKYFGHDGYAFGHYFVEKIDVISLFWKETMKVVKTN